MEDLERILVKRRGVSVRTTDTCSEDLRKLVSTSLPEGKVGLNYNNLGLSLANVSSSVSENYKIWAKGCGNLGVY